MIPAEIHAANARPMFREGTLFAEDCLFRHGEDSTAAEGRNALGAGLQLVLRIAGDDRGALVLGEMQDVVDRHGGDVTVG